MLARFPYDQQCPVGNTQPLMRQFAQCRRASAVRLKWPACVCLCHQLGRVPYTVLFKWCITTAAETNLSIKKAFSNESTRRDRCVASVRFHHQRLCSVSIWQTCQVVHWTHLLRNFAHIGHIEAFDSKASILSINLCGQNTI